MLRKARVGDIPAILKLVNFWAKRSRLLPVTKKALRKRLDLSWVWEIEGKVVGYVSLLIYRKELAEIRSLSVKKEYQRRGIGTELLKKALKEAQKRKITTVLTITIVPKFYKRLGFKQKLEGKQALLIDPRGIKKL